MSSSFSNFVALLWPTPPSGFPDACFTVWLHPSKKSLHVPLERALEMPDDDVAELLQLNSAGENVYFGLGLRREPLGVKRQGGRHDVIALPGFALDIDLADDVAHKAVNLPSSPEDVAKILDGEPEPTLGVASGFGLHVYWLFDQPLIVHDGNVRAIEADYEAFQRRLIERAANHGWHLDLTATVNRVWRLPGFANLKRRPDTRSVTVLYQSGPRYPVPVYRTPPAARGVGSANPGQPSASGGRSEASLDTVRSALRALSPASPNRVLVDLLLDGKSIAPRGERDAVLQRVCSSVAWMPALQGLEPELIAEVFRPSMSEWASEPGASLSADEEIAKVTDKLRRAQRDRREWEERQRKELSAVAAALCRPDEDEAEVEESPYAKMSAEELVHFAIVQKKTTFYLFDFERDRYSHPLVRDELLTYAKKAWENAPPIISLEYVNAKGEIKPKTMPQVLASYAVTADDVLGDMTLKKSYFDPKTRIFHEAVCPIRELKPEFDPNVDHWIRLLGGDQADKLLDWVASVTRLDKPCAMLYLSGTPGAGKSLLPTGLSRLWHDGGPTALTNVVGDYNDQIVRCPLILLDEGLPSRKGNVSALLRSLVASKQFEIHEKYVTIRRVRGAVRIVVAANNDDVIQFTDEQLTAQDLEAVVGRILHIAVGDEAEKWLSAHNAGNAMTTGWVDGDQIAKHALWLRDNRQVTPGRRFLVEGEKREMHRKLIMKSEATGLIIEWLARYLSNPSLYDRSAHKPPRVISGNGQFFVNVQGLVDCWEAYSKENRPTVAQTGRVLARFSRSTVRPRVEGDVPRIRYKKLDTDLILSWARSNQIGDETQIGNSLDRELPPLFLNVVDDVD